MPPRSSWSRLLPGLAALTVIASVTVGVLLFAGVGRMRGDTVRLYVLADQAQGVMAGTEVWLLGQKVGVVDDVRFPAPGADPGGRVVIVIDVRASDARAIRRDAPVIVRAGTNILGPVVVYLDGGGPAGPAVRSGDTLRARSQPDFQMASVKLSATAADLPSIMADARAIVANVRGRRGTMGALLAGDVGADVGRLRSNVARVGGSRAGVGAPEAAAALARADSIRALLRSDRSSMGRFRRDSTLARSIASVRDELAEARAVLERSHGTLQRWNRDSALTRSIVDAQREMTLLFDDVRRRPLRYFAF